MRAVGVGEGDGDTFGTTDLDGASHDVVSGVGVVTRDSRRKLRSMRGVTVIFGIDWKSGVGMRLKMTSRAVMEKRMKVRVCKHNQKVERSCERYNAVQGRG